MKRPELRAADLSTYLQNPPDEEHETAYDAYSHLGGFCFLAYSANHGHLQSPGVRHGFNVVARLIRCAVKLYPAYAEASGEPTDTEALKGILLNSEGTPVRFANMPKGMNHEIEAYFGLDKDKIPRDIDRLYKFEPNTHRGTIFIADDEAFYSATRQAEIESPITADTAGNRCRMMHTMRDEIWPRLVTLAAETPELMAADLLLPTASTVN